MALRPPASMLSHFLEAWTRRLLPSWFIQRFPKIASHARVRCLINVVSRHLTPSTFNELDSFSNAGVSFALPLEQKTMAREVARQIGIEYNEIPTKEGVDEGYIANLGKRCGAREGGGGIQSIYLPT